MSRRTSLALVALLVFSTAAIAVPAGGTAAYFGITNVSVSPSTPAPGETAIISISLENFQDSSSTLEVTDVAIRTGPGDSFKEKARIEDVGSLTPGASMTIPMPYAFESPGLHTLRIHVWTRSNGTNDHITYPLTVRVRSEHPALRLTDQTRVAGASSPFNVTVTNGLDSDIRDVSVQLRGADAGTDNTNSVASLAAGKSASMTFDVTPQETGDRTIDAVLSYTTKGGVRRSVNQTLHYEADPLQTGVSLETQRSGDGSAVTATLSNVGNVPVERIRVSGTIGDQTVERAVVGMLAPGQSTTVMLNASDVTQPTRMDVTASYRQAGQTGTVSASETVSGNPATIELTGLNIEREGDTIHVTGSTSNLGLQPASSVVVRVLSGDGVSPAYPGRTYFVGSVPSSDFVSFDVYADVTANATAVPLEVTYLRNGIPHRTTVEVPIEDVATQQPTQPQSTGPSLPAIGIGLVVVVGVGALIYVGWRNYRAGA